MPANIYNKINQQQRQQNVSTPNISSNVPNSNTPSISDGKIHEAQIIPEHEYKPQLQPKKLPRIQPIQTQQQGPLGVSLGLGLIDNFGKNVEKHYGLEDSGLYDYLKPTLHQVIKESPLGMIPNPLINILGSIITKKLLSK
jgi:hypothetical protein